MPEMLNCKPLKVAAEGNSASETIWGMIDVQAGALMANPTPMKNTQPRMRQGLRRRSQPSTAKVKVVAAKQTLTVHTSFWRSTLSARAPAGSVNRNKGRDATVDINDSNNGDPLEIFIVQVAALSWAATQVPEITAAIQSFLNAGFRSAIQVEFVFMIGGFHLVTNAARFQSFRNFVPNHAFGRYCW
jgi:hypothetical protein